MVLDLDYVSIKTKFISCWISEITMMVLCSSCYLSLSYKLSLSLLGSSSWWPTPILLTLCYWCTKMSSMLSVIAMETDLCVWERSWRTLSSSQVRDIAYIDSERGCLHWFRTRALTFIPKEAVYVDSERGCLRWFRTRLFTLIQNEAVYIDSEWSCLHWFRMRLFTLLQVERSILHQGHYS